MRELLTEKLIKRYLLEQAYENGVNIPTFGELYYEDMMYEKLKKGEITITNFDWFPWIENLKRNKRHFGNYLKSIGYLTCNQNVTEITDDEEVNSINVTALIEKKIIVSQAGEGCFGKPYIKHIRGHLVINGVYDNQLIYLSNLLKDNDNSFTICYYSQSDSEYTKRVIEYYKALRKFLSLMTGKNSIEVIEDNVSYRDKVYVLAYNTKPQVHEPVPVITRHSER